MLMKLKQSSHLSLAAAKKSFPCFSFFLSVLWCVDLVGAEQILSKLVATSSWKMCRRREEKRMGRRMKSESFFGLLLRCFIMFFFFLLFASHLASLELVFIFNSFLFFMQGRWDREEMSRNCLLFFSAAAKWGTARYRCMVCSLFKTI